MALATKPQLPHAPAQRLWKTPFTRAAWVWFVLSIALYGGVYLWFFLASKTAPPDPASDPFRIFGIIAFVLMLVVAAYSLRRRFVRVLPGKVQSWLWMHTWLGVISLLIAFLHENYQNILTNYAFDIPTFTAAAGGMAALYALLLLVLSGSTGRLLDYAFARVIAKEARSNGVGIIQAVEGRIRELDLLLERLSAGKSDAFKHYCSQANREMQPALAPNERNDFQQAYEVLTKRETLQRSLTRQRVARRVIAGWRYTHSVLACGALVVVCIHATVELTKMVQQLLGHG